MFNRGGLTTNHPSGKNVPSIAPSSKAWYKVDKSGLKEESKHSNANLSDIQPNLQSAPVKITKKLRKSSTVRAKDDFDGPKVVKSKRKATIRKSGTLKMVVQKLVKQESRVSSSDASSELEELHPLDLK